LFYSRRLIFSYTAAEDPDSDWTYKKGVWKFVCINAAATAILLSLLALVAMADAWQFLQGFS
jgi:hypothetical protein